MNRLSVFLIILAGLTAVLFAPVLFTADGIAGNAGDVYLHYYPLKYQISEQLMTGQLPLWNPYIFNGQPLQANPQSALFYPLSVVFYVLSLPVAFNWFTAVHFLLAGVFFHLLLLSRGIGRSGALAGTLAFAFSAFLVYRVPAGHPVALSGYIWLPAVILALDAVLKRGDAASILLLAGTLVFQFLSGHTFPFYISAVYIAFHALYHRLAHLRALALAGAAFILVSAVQLVPSLQLSRAAETSNWPALVENYSLPLGSLITAVLPGAFGTPVDHSFIQPDNPSYFYELYSLYIGILPLLLAVAGLVYSIRRRRWFWPSLLALGLILALGFNTPVYRVLYRLVPGMSFLRVPARFFYLCVVALAVLAAVGWQRYLSSARPAVKIGLAVLVAADHLFWSARFVYRDDLSGYRTPSPLSGEISPLYHIVTGPDEVAANKSMLYHHYNTNGYEAIFLRDFVRYIGLQEKRFFGSTGLARIDLDSPLARGLTIGYALTSDPMPEAEPLMRLAGSLTLYRMPRPLPRVYLAQTVAAIPDEEVFELMEYLRTTENPPDREIVVNRMPDWFPGASGGGRLVAFASRPGALAAEMVLPEPAAVVFGDVYYPGWKAWAGETPLTVYRGNRLFPTVFLPQGDYTGDRRLVLYFDPASWRFGLYVTLLTLIAGGLLLAYRPSAVAGGDGIAGHTVI